MPEALEETTQRKDVTHVVFILDASGSMGVIHGQAIELFNQQVEAVRANPSPKTTVSFATFGINSRPQIHYLGQPLDKLEKLTAQTYQPDGSTPMNDAIGKTLERVEAEVVDTNEDYAVLVVIVSDGQENFSGRWQNLTGGDPTWRHYTPGDIKELIGRLEKTDRWTFTYMGANQNLEHVAATYGLNLMNTKGFTSNPATMALNTHDHTNATGRYFAARSAGLSKLDAFYEEDEREAK